MIRKVRAEVARKLTLGAQFLYNNQYSQTETTYLKALEIRKRLAKDNPERFEPEVARTQNDLGVMYANLNAYDQAKAAYMEALEIYLRLAKDNPEPFEPDVAMTKHNLGNMYADLNAYDQAKATYLEALEINRRLTKDNPEPFEPEVARTQNSLRVMYANLKIYDQAKAAYLEALEIYLRLAKDNPEFFEPMVAKTQNNLGVMYADLNAYDQAKAAYKEALEIYLHLAKDNPERYNLYLANTLKNIGYLHKALLEQHLNLAYQSSGLAYAKQAEGALSLYSTDIPIVKNYSYLITELISYFENVTEEDLRIQAQINKALPLEEKNETETDPAKKAANQAEVVGILENIWQQYPKNAIIIPRLANAYGVLAWYQLFNRHFLEAEQAAYKGMDIDPSQEWINTNLALGLLFQGKYEEAKEIYLRLKNKPYGGATYLKAFLDDLEALEKKGITHPDVEKVRELLEK